MRTGTSDVSDASVLETRCSLMKYGGVFHMGVHKAVFAEAGVKPGARVDVTIERDTASTK